MTRISLKRRFVLQNLLLVGGMLAAGAVSILRLQNVAEKMNVSRTVYSELRTVGNVAVYAGTVQGLLSDPQANRERIITHLTNAIGGLDQFITVSNGYGNSDTDADMKLAYVPINQAADAARGKLQSVLAAIKQISPLTAAQAEIQRNTVAAALADIDAAAGSCIRFIGGRQQNASADLATNLVVIGLLSLAAVAAAIILSIRQYRLIMKPLLRLRAGVREMGEARFTHPLDPATMGHSPEFIDLAADFNRMARELDEFYRNLEEQVRSKSRELVRSERLASVGFLAAGVAHEINNPLNVISGYAELASRKLEPDRLPIDDETVAQMRENLRIIREEAFRCKDITDKLLSLSRNGEDARDDLDLGLVARDVAAMTRGLKNYRDRRVTVNLDPSAPLEVRANLTEMKQVLLNLTINALESVTPTSGEVWIEGRQKEGWVELCVKDNGRGMNAEVLSHVFEPFFTSRPCGALRGTGLGLSITHAIVESHQGRIEAESDGPGCGARFTVRLPARRGRGLA